MCLSVPRGRLQEADPDFNQIPKEVRAPLSEHCHHVGMGEAWEHKRTGVKEAIRRTPVGRNTPRSPKKGPMKEKQVNKAMARGGRTGSTPAALRPTVKRKSQCVQDQTDATRGGSCPTANVGLGTASGGSQVTGATRRPHSRRSATSIEWLFHLRSLSTVITPKGAPLRLAHPGLDRRLRGGPGASLPYPSSKPRGNAKGAQGIPLGLQLLLFQPPFWDVIEYGSDLAWWTGELSLYIGRYDESCLFSAASLGTAGDLATDLVGGAGVVDPVSLASKARRRTPSSTDSRSSSQSFTMRSHSSSSTVASSVSMSLRSSSSRATCRRTALACRWNSLASRISFVTVAK